MALPHARDFGIITLGNTGVGKSFLCNILYGSERFAHEVSAASVTSQTEYAVVSWSGFKIQIFNIPGLIEAEQERIEINKREIQKAFSQQPNSIVIYVFGNQNGRIRDEDVVAFNALHQAYEFKQESTLIVFNAVPVSRPETYESSTVLRLEKLLKIGWVTDCICFLDQINPENDSHKQYLRDKLLQHLVTKNASIYRLKHEIIMLTDMLNQLKKEVQKQVQEIQMLETAHRRRIEELQKKFNAAADQRQDEKHSLEIARMRAEKEYWETKTAEEKRKADKDKDSSCSIS